MGIIFVLISIYTFRNPGLSLSGFVVTYGILAVISGIADISFYVRLMASMLRVSRITVARTIKELKDLSLIENINGFLCIRDEKKLRSHMYYIGMPLE